MRFSKTQTITIILPFKCTHFLCFVTQIKFVLCRFFRFSHLEESSHLSELANLSIKIFFRINLLRYFGMKVLNYSQCNYILLMILKHIFGHIVYQSSPSRSSHHIYANSLGIECQYWGAVAPQQFTACGDVLLLSPWGGNMKTMPLWDFLQRQRGETGR